MSCHSMSVRVCLEPWLAMDSEWYRVNNTRREIAQSVCNGANQNIFGPAGNRQIENQNSHNTGT